MAGNPAQLANVAPRGYALVEMVTLASDLEAIHSLGPDAHDAARRAVEHTEWRLLLEAADSAHRDSTSLSKPALYEQRHDLLAGQLRDIKVGVRSNVGNS